VSAPAGAWRLPALALAVASLVAGIGGGLARLGAAPAFAAVAIPHAALMIGGFLATVIALERAVALGVRWAYAAPFLSGAGAIALVAGLPQWAIAPWLAAPVVFIAANIAIARKQLALHTAMFVVAAGCWAAGNALFVFASAQAAIAPWFTFLVLTIAAERLEMTRLMKRSRFSRAAFALAAAILLAGAFTSQWLFGAGLLAVAAWLATYDIARRTLWTSGFARYSAVALVAGYAWLAVAGAAWCLAHAGFPVSRDLALHALGLGFIFSMIMAHGPVIIPAVARIRMRFTAFFYVPLAALHASLALRLVAGHADFELRRAGGILNAVAIALFAATLVLSIRRTLLEQQKHNIDRAAGPGGNFLRL
jgi:hypothetical protein